MRIRLSALGFWLSAFSVALGAQDVVPGLTLTVSMPAKPDTIVFRRTVTRNGVDSSGGTRTVVVQSRKAFDGSPVFHVTQRFPAQFGEIVDTAIADARTLRAMSHQSHQPLRTMRFAFKNGGADGQLSWQSSSAAGPKGSSGAPGSGGESQEPLTQDVRQELGGSVFDSNIIEFVVAALPLKDGFKVDLPFFIYERGGKVVMPVSVRERVAIASASGTRQAWVVSVGVPDVPATVWVDADTRAVLRVKYEAPKSTYTDERSTPLP